MGKDKDLKEKLEKEAAKVAEALIRAADEVEVKRQKEEKKK